MPDHSSTCARTAHPWVPPERLQQRQLAVPHERPRPLTFPRQLLHGGRCCGHSWLHASPAGRRACSSSDHTAEPTTHHRHQPPGSEFDLPTEAPRIVTPHAISRSLPAAIMGLRDFFRRSSGGAKRKPRVSTATWSFKPVVVPGGCEAPAGPTAGRSSQPGPEATGHRRRLHPHAKP
jgi:hypothetical protein